MFTVFGSHRNTDCSGVSRRDFLRAGSLGLGGLGLADLIRAKAAAAADGNPAFVKDKAIVFLFLSGGASHIETFDPRMDAPAEIRSVTGEVPTALPGVTFGGSFEGLAKRANKMAVVRSFNHHIGGHEQAIVHVLTGGTDNTGQGNEGFSLGSMYTRLRGTNHPVSGMPTYALLNSNEVDPQYSREKARVQFGSRPGSLGAAFGPFDPGSGGTAVDNMKLGVTADQLENRRNLLTRLDALNRKIDAEGLLAGMDKFEQQAFNLLLGGAGKAFDLSKEDPKVLESYDTSKINIGFKKFRPSDLGRLMLLSRRLVETGAGFVTVHSAGWDMHADGNNPGVETGFNMLGKSMDKAVSAFLDDLAVRGLSDKVLLVISGDFGRSPKINKKGGRDHWAKLGTLAFAGGGLKMGQVIGKSDVGVGSPATAPIKPAELMSTMMHTLFDVPTLRLESGVPKEIAKSMESGKPIAELF